MKRRDFLKAACAGLSLSGMPSTWLWAAQIQPQKPNIVMIFVDDNVVETIKRGGLCPNIRSLGKKGVTFTHSYTPHGVCGPARFALLSGRLMSRCVEDHCATPESRIHGSTAMGGLTIEGQRFIWSGSILAREWNMAKLLKRAGYQTFYAGKVHGHMQDAPVDSALESAAKSDPWKKQELMRKKLQQAGWDWAEALSAGNLGNHAQITDGILAGRHHPEWRAQATIRFIERNKDNPFFCYIAENLMHMQPPWEDLKKDPRVAFDGIIFDKPLNVMPPRKTVLERVRQAGKDEKESAALLWLDDMVGAILKKLDDLKLRDNTMVVFMQDNGHLREGKNSVYQGGIHVSPTYISWPAGLKNPGRTCSELVSSLDMVPTFLDAAGVKPPADCVLDGNSLMPIIKDRRSQTIHDSLYAEMGHTRAVVTRKWKYIALRVPPSREFTPEEKDVYENRVKRDSTGLIKKMGCRVTHMQGSTPGVAPPTWQAHQDHYFDRDQLYDLEKDPAERKNLAHDSRYAAVLADMKQILRAHCMQLPGTFAEFKTLDDCPRALRERIAEARQRPLIPVTKKRKITDKMPNVIRKIAEYR